MNAEDVDLDYLISLVQERPSLWDKSNDDFCNRFRKANEWAAVCKLLIPEYENLDDTKKNKIGNDVVKKWRSVKDNFFRYAKKIKENSASGSAAKKIKKYHYYNQLLFLMKVAQNKGDNSLQQETENSSKNETPTTELQPSSPITAPGPSRYVPASRKRPHLGMDDFETVSLETLREKENRHLSFFKGILPSLDNFSELQILTFQSKVIQIITEMRFGQQTQLSSSTPSTSYGYQTAEYQGNNSSSNASRNDINTYQTAEYQGNSYSSNSSHNEINMFNCNDDSQEEFDFTAL